jgi:hypothetical protein
MKPKIKTFEDVKDYLKSIPYINMGGCALSAYAMFLWLKKNNQLPKKFKFVFLSDGEYADNARVIKTKKGNAKACGHVVIKINGQMMDCRGFYTNYQYDKFIEFTPRREWFIINALNNGDWAKYFDTDNVQNIADALEIDLSHIHM